MKVPEVTLDNYEAVYDFYEQHQQPQLQALAYYALLAAKFRPDVHYAEGVQDVFSEDSWAGSSYLIAMNHLTDRDQFIAAATAFRSPLRSRIGHMRVVGHDGLFRDKHRRSIDILGALPAFRSKDYVGASRGQLLGAGNRFIDTCAMRLEAGDSIGIFVEGTRNQTDPTMLGQVQSGIGHIALRAAKLGARFSILPLGISYGPDPEPQNFTHASVFIGTPFKIDDPDARPKQIANQVRDSLQFAVDQAHALYRGPNL